MSAAAVPRICWPFVIDSTNKNFKLRKSSTDYSGSLTERTYYTPEALLYEFQTRAQAAITATGATIAMSLLPTGQTRVQVTGGGATTWYLKWDSTGCAPLGVLLGYSNASKPTPTPTFGSTFGGQVTLDSERQLQQLWIPGVPPRTETPSSAYARAVVESTGGVVNVNLATLRRRRIVFEKIVGNKIFTENETLVNEAIERLWTYGSGALLYFPDAANTGLGATPASNAPGNGQLYSLDEESDQSFEPKRSFLAGDYYDIELRLVGTN